jgi:hypothetical protein
MSRTRNKHDKSWNAPKREAKYYSNKNRRRHGKKYLIEAAKYIDGDDNEMSIDVPKNAGAGDIWAYD